MVLRVLGGAEFDVVDVEMRAQPVVLEPPGADGAQDGGPNFEPPGRIATPISRAPLPSPGSMKREVIAGVTEWAAKIGKLVLGISTSCHKKIGPPPVTGVDPGLPLYAVVIVGLVTSTA